MISKCSKRTFHSTTGFSSFKSFCGLVFLKLDGLTKRKQEVERTTSSRIITNSTHKNTIWNKGIANSEVSLTWNQRVPGTSWGIGKTFDSFLRIVSIWNSSPFCNQWTWVFYHFLHNSTIKEKKYNTHVWNSADDYNPKLQKDLLLARNHHFIIYQTLSLPWNPRRLLSSRRRNDRKLMACFPCISVFKVYKITH